MKARRGGPDERKVGEGEATAVWRPTPAPSGLCRRRRDARLTASSSRAGLLQRQCERSPIEELIIHPGRSEGDSIPERGPSRGKRELSGQVRLTPSPEVGRGQS